jgi:HlyD family type I secretion membrane fusion protein
MKLDLGPVHGGYVAPTFGPDELATPLHPQLQKRLRKPMLLGAAIIGTMVLGLGVWAAVTPLASGVSVPGQVTVESSLMTIRHKEPGIVRQIFVKEGQFVRAGQVLLTFDDTDLKAAVSILQNQVDSLQAQIARLSAEALDKPSVTYPPELMARASDPQVAGLIRDQDFLFASRRQLVESQMSVLQQRLEQSQNQIQGDQAQLDSVEQQRKLTVEEENGYRQLYEKGYAPKTLILRYDRQVADLQGKKGSLLADMARLRQQMGETRMQMASVRDQRTSQAAEQLRDSETKLEEAQPKLVATSQALAQTRVVSPVDGYVFNLTQFTPGGVGGGNEPLMQIVPAKSPLVVSVSVSPQFIDQVHVGMPAKVRLIGPNPRWTKQMPATVTMVSPDRTVNQKTGESFYRADLTIAPKDLQETEKHVKLTPGMNASAMIVTGDRTLMGFLIQPITDTMQHAFREE